MATFLCFCQHLHVVQTAIQLKKMYLRTKMCLASSSLGGHAVKINKSIAQRMAVICVTVSTRTDSLYL